MTIWDGHGRTPHDTLETILSTAAWIVCFPCLCVVGCSKIKLPGQRRNEEVTKETPKRDKGDVFVEEL
jgi:hypothetical protein